MQTAGHAVVASGVTVAISLLALVIVPVPFLRSMGLGGMLIPLVSVAVVLTLLPAMLSRIGPRVDWPRIRHEGRAVARLVGLGPAASCAAAGSPPASRVVVLGAAHRAGVRPQDRAVRASTRWPAAGPRSTPCRRSTEGGVGDGVLTPIEVLVPDDQARRRGRPRPTASHGVADGRRSAATDGDHASSTSSRRRDGRQRQHRRRRRRPHRRRGRRSTATSGSPASARSCRTTSARCTTTSRTCWR